MRWRAPILVVLLTLVSRGRGAGRHFYRATHREMRPRYLKGCPGTPSNALTSVDVDYQMQGRTTIVINFNATVVRSVDRWSKAKMVFEKCDEQVSPETCANFRVLDIMNVCSLMMNPNMPWAKVVAEVQPRLGCPVSANTYSLANGTLNMELLNTMSGAFKLEGPIWRFRAHVFDGKDQIHMCVDGAGEFFRVRNNLGNSPTKG